MQQGFPKHKRGGSTRYPICYRRQAGLLIIESSSKSYSRSVTQHPVVLQLSVSNKLLDYYGHHPIGIEHTKRKAPLMNYRKV